MLVVSLIIVTLVATCLGWHPHQATSRGVLSRARNGLDLKSTQRPCQRSQHFHSFRYALTTALGMSESSSSLADSDDKSAWTSVMSTNQDLDKAVEEVLSQIAAEGKPYELAIFYVSTIYEASSQKYDTIFNQLKKSVPGCKFVLGTTTGAVIGPTTPFGEPIELEGRAGFSLTLGNFDDDVRLSTFSLDKAAVYNYIRNPQQRLRQSALTDTCSVLVFTTEQVKPYLSDFLNQLESREGGAAFGAIASGVTSLHQPKVFVVNSDDDDDSDNREAEEAAPGYTRYTAGAVGLVLEGNIEVKTVVARSCLPVGPVYEVREREGKDILSLVPVGAEGGAGSADEGNFKLSPLEALDYVIKTISHDHADALKRELLVGAVPDIDLKEGERVEDLIFFGQKPLTFDPISGSLTLSSVPGGAEADKLLFRFCIRDVETARDDIESASKQERALLSQHQVSVQACVLLGSMERGNKMFRQNGWEASKLYDSLHQTQTKVPISGMFAQGAFGKVAVGLPGTAAQHREIQSLVEADSLHAFFMKRQDSTTSAGTNTGTEAEAEAEAEAVGGGSNGNDHHTSNHNSGRDVCSAFELVKFADDADLVIVEKRDPESAAPVRVATMDYVIPEKSPQPSNVLESIVWDREQAVDRMRERFQLTKALMQATRSELKYPVRSISEALTRTDDNNGGGAIVDGSLALVLEFNRATLHNGKIVDGSMGDSDVSRLAAAKAQVEAFSASVESLLSNEDSMVSKGVRVAATGAHLDAGTFRGSYEDLETLRESPTGKVLPVIANDFVLYAYQLFKAKSSGADAIKLHASILPPTEISYMAKIARKINLEVVVVVSTMPQLIEVLGSVPELNTLSISNRNMRLWKIAPGKALRILSDPDVRAVLTTRRLAGADGGGINVMLEGLSTPEEMVAAREDPLVDGVFLAEELVPSRLSVAEAVQSLLGSE